MWSVGIVTESAFTPVDFDIYITRLASYFFQCKIN